MTGITRRFAIPVGLAALAPAASRAGGGCKRQRRHVRARLGSGGACRPDRNGTIVPTLNDFEDQNTVDVTLTSAAGNPQVFTPEAFAAALARSTVQNSDNICDAF